MKISVILFAFLFCTLFACAQTDTLWLKADELYSSGDQLYNKYTNVPFTGFFYTDFYGTNAMGVKSYYINGKMSGKSYTYYDNGKTFSVSHYIDGVNEGEYYEYYLSGEILIKGNYHLNYKEGQWLYYDKNGEVLIDGYFHEDYKSGEWKYYNLKGKLYMVESYSDTGIILKTKVFKAKVPKTNILYEFKGHL